MDNQKRPAASEKTDSALRPAKPSAARPAAGSRPAKPNVPVNAPARPAKKRNGSGAVSKTGNSFVPAVRKVWSKAVSFTSAAVKKLFCLVRAAGKKASSFARSARKKTVAAAKRLPPFKTVLSAVSGFFVRLWNAVCAFVRRLPFRWPVYAAGGAAIILAVVLCIVLIPGKPDAAINEPVAVQTTPVPEVASTPDPTATPEPTAEPSPEPTAEPTAVMSAKYKVLKGIPNTDRALGLPKCEQVDHSYFNDTVFIGDSVSEKLHLYVTKMRRTYPELLGNAKFITTPSLSSRNALKPVSDTSLHPTIRGKKMPIEDAVALSGAKKVYVMLGMNDVGITGVNQSVKDLFTLLRKIKDKCPDIQIFVQSATPRMNGEKPTTEQLFKYNLKVYEYCLKYTDYDIYFVDVAYAMRNKYGNLTGKYCSDPQSMAIHFTDEGCKKWIQFLYTHALV